jgi:6-phosphofructokinase 1
MMKKRLGLLTGGGDVPPLNALIASAAETARAAGVKLIGFIKGWQGVLEEKFVELTEFPLNPEIGGTVLKSSRTGLGRAENGRGKALGVLKKLGLEGLIVVGGEDTLSNAFQLGGFRQVLIAKTIDNDVGKMDACGNEKTVEFDPENVLNYFTLGFPTAAEKIASFVSLKEGLRTTAYSHERIIVVEAMGMHAGWLALAAGLGHPDFIIIPEFPLDYKRFLDAVISGHRSQRHLIIVVAEGAKWEDGSFISAEDDKGPDYGHPRFGGAAEALKKKLIEDLTPHFDTRNINVVNPSYIYRSGAPNALDRAWAEKLGRSAVENLLGPGSEPVLMTIQKRKAGFEVGDYPLSRFASMAELHRFVDDRFYDPESYRITDTGKSYLKEIAHEFIPEREYGLHE